MDSAAFLALRQVAVMMGAGAGEQTTKRAIAARLRLTRLALMDGVDNQAEWARRVGIRPSTWNNYEEALNRISLDEALKICQATGISLDWIYFGSLHSLPHSLALKIQRYQAANSK